MDNPTAGSNECSYCLKTYSGATELDIHIRMVHLGKKYECDEKNCGKKYSCMKVLQNHKIASHGNEVHCCEFCDKKYPSIKSLKYHIIRYHNDSRNEFDCNKCEKKFFSIQGLDYHVKAVHEENVFHCETCGKKFSVFKNKILHEANVHTDRLKNLTAVFVINSSSLNII